MRAARALAAAALAAILAAGCSVVQAPERPAWRVFALEPGAAALRAGAADPAGPVVVVASPGSGAGYSTRRMAYSRGDGELEYYAEHRWADTPARMLLPLLRDALAATGSFSAVAAAPTRAVPDLVVESEISTFRMELDGDELRFRAVLRVTVVRSGSGGGTRSRTFEATEALEVAAPTDAVAAANRTVARLLADVAAFCADVAAPSASS